ncbi:Gfo/Idh/MocA family oxidoreductase [Paenibacillus antri]|uniref:Gfo/Idh/MocA family oxidoreductase n=1 Tax=Paenibacillus antri TaxID=2582848 RepID=A0A5R9GGS7_9BACL|nr:Gfo/Idh/MocA family oxidoreductase [Paenibacillus antri]TLS52588.1 Gfo/Idh/MocA family oxidoreductase [Paenibacillus antri]
MNESRTIPPLRFAVYGCQHGHIESFIQAMKKLGHTFIGIYDEHPIPLTYETAEKHGVPLFDRRGSLDAADLVGCAAANDEKIDAVEWCVARKKPIMVDKPIVLHRDGLRRLERATEAEGSRIGMMLTSRYKPSIFTLRNDIAAGKYGDVVSISMRKPHRLTPERRPAWFFDKARHGGIAVDLLIHDFDLLRWLTGREIVDVACTMTKKLLPEHPTFYDVVTASAIMEGGLACQLYSDWHTPTRSWTWGDGRIFVVGTRGTAELRLEGDPGLAVMDKNAYISVTDEAGFAIESVDAPALGIVEQFVLHAFGGGEAGVTHRDILLASEAAIRADEKATFIQ